VGEGRVVSNALDASQLVIGHDEIKGFMDAMSMGDHQGARLVTQR
jgi:hypothetical protein